MSEFIPYGRQFIEDDDIAAVARALRSDFLTNGPEVEAFEREFAQMVGSRHAIACCNATAALHLCMLVVGVGKGDRVVTSPNTFLASANCAAFVGATPDFCDIDPTTHTLCPDSLLANWQPDTRAVIAVAYAGQAANMVRIAEVARARGAVVIEDACHGVGTEFVIDGRTWSLGAHPWADLSTFSFHPVKGMTTAEGGMITTNDDEYARRARLLRSHGVQRDPAHFLSPGGSDPLAERGPWFYEMQELGYNYRLTDVQCALGRSQLRKLSGFNLRRREIVERYNAAFADCPFLLCPSVGHWGDAGRIAWHLYTVQIDFAALGTSRAEVMQALRAGGVGSQVLYMPVYLQPYYRETFGYGPGKCPVAEAYYASALSLPLYPLLRDAEVDRVIAVVRETLFGVAGKVGG